MIGSFRSRDAEALFNRKPVRRFPPDILRVPPANHLEALKGDRQGQHSIRINDQWRICFRWERGDAYDVEIADDHRG